ncbi:MSHA biogenesis protein MshP [Vibrio metschnikovii]|uniref:MSHA biogenesis protein MshP n=1 Tax=Vibrio metschnikovii TaxID=28172 RepID=UPI0029FB358B|nr:MSHA biogenesis protein MshP [Vibrio metschnikovii]EKO3688599.1 MSHA biogenesis protein MshP [Vibrio metschnikovii]EKO3689882.1 MSHA biogenesis protein MshP [Vibrio metschnikovii]EKO3707450.1 MSHA biogenesis protein MshP [Vibrio metschnikovii]
MHLSTTRRSQQGSGLVIVIFIIVVVGLVAAVANRNQQRNSQQLVSMVMGTRAEMAARSAAEIEISRYYQENNQQSSCRQAEDRTGTSDIGPITFQGDGLAQCKAQISCEYIGVLDNQQTVLQITSEGRCCSGGWSNNDWECLSGAWPWQRTIQVGVRGDE